MTLKSAAPTLQDMVGAHIQYIHAEPFQRATMIETGVIIAIQERGEQLQIRVKPDNCRLMSKWRDADKHLLKYIRQPEMKKATA